MYPGIVSALLETYETYETYCTLTEQTIRVWKIWACDGCGCDVPPFSLVDGFRWTVSNCYIHVEVKICPWRRRETACSSETSNIFTNLEDNTSQTSGILIDPVNASLFNASQQDTISSQFVSSVESEQSVFDGSETPLSSGSVCLPFHCSDEVDSVLTQSILFAAAEWNRAPGYCRPKRKFRQG
jgi:hypothetical protein